MSLSRQLHIPLFAPLLSPVQQTPLQFASPRAQSVRVVTLLKPSLARYGHEKRCVLSSSIGELSLCEGSSTAKFAGRDG